MNEIPIMPIEKRRRAASAVMFLFGVLATMNAVKEANSFWPPAALWAALNPPHRFQLCGGIAVILVGIFTTIFARRD